jgi:hypothetical protein
MGQSRDEVLSIIKPAVVGWIDEVLSSSPAVSSQIFVSSGGASGVASGDLTGNYPAPVVDGIQGRAVSATAPSTGQVYRWNGSLWLPGNISDIAGTITDTQHGNRAGGALHSAATTSTLGFVELATDGEVAAGTVVQGNDSRLSNARTPTAHASTHHSGGSDPLALGSIAGTLTDAQHGSRAGGTLHPAATTAVAGFATLAADGGAGAGTVVQGNDSRLSNARAPTAHASTHHSGGSDPLALGSLAGTLTDAQHGSRAGGTLHAAATTSALGFVELATDGESAANVVVQGNDSRLSNARTPTGTASGDLAGTYPSPTVDGLQGRAVAATAPTTGQMLAWSGSDWAPIALNAVKGTRLVLRRAAGLAINFNTLTDFTWDTEVTDEGGWFSGPSHQVSLPVGVFSVAFTAGVSGAVNTAFRTNTTFNNTTGNTAVFDHTHLDGVLYLNHYATIVMPSAGTFSISLLHRYSTSALTFGGATYEFGSLIIVALGQ